MMSELASWPHLYVPGRDDLPVALTLHGTGGDENDVSTLGQVLMPGSTILSPRGRVSEGGMNRWFRRLGEGVFDVDDVIVRSGELADFIVWATENYGLGGRTIVALGFSNGANIASATALLHPDILNRAVVLSGMYPFGDRDPIGDATAVALLVANGTHDPMAPLESATRLENIATEHGARVTRSLRSGGHGITQDDVVAATEWIRDNVSS
jgi:phospholipase/carboxylesterase